MNEAIPPIRQSASQPASGEPPRTAWLRSSLPIDPPHCALRLRQSSELALYQWRCRWFPRCWRLATVARPLHGSAVPPRQQARRARPRLAGGPRFVRTSDSACLDHGASVPTVAMLGWPGMEQIVALVRDYMHAEADAGYPLLRQIPSTRATACFDYLESTSSAEREELLDANARVTGLGFVLTPAAQQE